MEEPLIVLKGILGQWCRRDYLTFSINRMGIQGCVPLIRQYSPEVMGANMEILEVMRKLSAD